MRTGDMNGSTVLVSRSFPADVRQHVLALAEAGLLDRVFTGYVHVRSGTPERLLNSLAAPLSQRLLAWSQKRPPLDGVADDLVMRMPLLELGNMVTRRLLMQFVSVLGEDDCIEYAISRRAARRLTADHSLVMGREMEACDVFMRAAELDVPRLYQQPTAHYSTVRRILEREEAEFPCVCSGSSSRTSHAPQRLARKDAELKLATAVLAPSQFVKQSLVNAGAPEDRVMVLPFGCEPDWESPNVKRRDNLFLHAGQLSMRKGTHRLLQAWKRLGAHRTCELRLIGSMRLTPKFLSGFQGTYSHIGRLPRHELRRHYAEASCFVLPALAEGFAVVVLEAMSCGTPVALSRNTGAEGFITDRQEGLLFDAQDDEALENALEWMLTHPTERQEMSRHCLQRAHSWTWGNYRREFLDLVRRTMRVEVNDCVIHPCQ